MGKDKNKSKPPMVSEHEARLMAQSEKNFVRYEHMRDRVKDLEDRLWNWQCFSVVTVIVFIVSLGVFHGVFVD